MSDLWGASDEALVGLVHEHDHRAVAVLQQRHEAAALALAEHHLGGGSAGASDCVAEAFPACIEAIRAGDFGSTAFRPYLLERVMRSARGRDSGSPPPSVDRVHSAFSSLAATHQTVLWQADIEGAPIGETARLVGTGADDVAPVLVAARAELREALIDDHLTAETDQRCRGVTLSLEGYLSGTLTSSESRHVVGHLEECDRCKSIYLEVGEASNSLRNVLAPAILGPGGLQALGSVGGGPFAQLNDKTQQAAAASAAAVMIVGGGFAATQASANVASVVDQPPSIAAPAASDAENPATGITESLTDETALGALSDPALSDSALSDSALSDSALSDSAPSDTAPSDTAPSDSAPSDSAPSDAGAAASGAGTAGASDSDAASTDEGAPASGDDAAASDAPDAAEPSAEPSTVADRELVDSLAYRDATDDLDSPAPALPDAAESSGDLFGGTTPTAVPIGADIGNTTDDQSAPSSSAATGDTANGGSTTADSTSTDGSSSADTDGSTSADTGGSSSADGSATTDGSSTGSSSDASGSATDSSTTDDSTTGDSAGTSTDGSSDSGATTDTSGETGSGDAGSSGSQTDGTGSTSSGSDGSASDSNGDSSSDTDTSGSEASNSGTGSSGSETSPSGTDATDNTGSGAGAGSGSTDTSSAGSDSETSEAGASGSGSESGGVTDGGAGSSGETSPGTGADGSGASDTDGSTQGGSTGGGSGSSTDGSTQGGSTGGGSGSSTGTDGSTQGGSTGVDSGTSTDGGSGSGTNTSGAGTTDSDGSTTGSSDSDAGSTGNPEVTDTTDADGTTTTAEDSSASTGGGEASTDGSTSGGDPAARGSDPDSSEPGPKKPSGTTSGTSTSGTTTSDGSTGSEQTADPSPVAQVDVAMRTLGPIAPGQVGYLEIIVNEGGSQAVEGLQLSIEAPETVEFTVIEQGGNSDSILACSSSGSRLECPSIEVASGNRRSMIVMVGVQESHVGPLTLNVVAQSDGQELDVLGLGSVDVSAPATAPTPRLVGGAGSELFFSGSANGTDVTVDLPTGGRVLAAYAYWSGPAGSGPDGGGIAERVLLSQPGGQLVTALDAERIVTDAGRSQGVIEVTDYLAVVDGDVITLASADGGTVDGWVFVTVVDTESSNRGVVLYDTMANLASDEQTDLGVTVADGDRVILVSQDVDGVAARQLAIDGQSSTASPTVDTIAGGAITSVAIDGMVDGEGQLSISGDDDGEWLGVVGLTLS